ncbi:hypothetical protein [Fulvivirga sedimenti]|uniref:Outer membrane protein beta-barrel domain-containing protein n=1 Tax=Fulvivirga sedimenti TaxID=2879465 RepID=A0A9X1HVG0_9BACT|nr:hypothetical protein [Fulvivirga sedimenti]MCA6079014.1 hypothetical protein [Fulvivirga sedimenti]
MSRVLILILIFLIPSLLFAQEQPDVYDNEFVWGVSKNTSGGLIGGFMARKSRRLNDRMFESFGIELVNVKHSQEIRRNSITGNFYIYGKSNYLYSIRAQYGREYILFRKAPSQGVEIKAIGAVGPSIGILAPYYIEYTTSRSAIISRTEQYNPNNEDHSIDQILGTGRLFQGLFESKLRIGANLKAALSFELGTSKSNVTGFEIGMLLDAYAGDIILMPTAENKSVFPTAFITLFYGSRR